MRCTKSLITATVAILATSCLYLVLSGCSSGQSLSDREMAKIHTQVQRLLAGERVPELDEFSGLRSDGSREYPLIIRMTDLTELDAIGLKPQSQMGQVVTVRATLKEIESLARLPSVISIEPGSRNEPTNSVHQTLL